MPKSQNLVFSSPTGTHLRVVVWCCSGVVCVKTEHNQRDNTNIHIFPRFGFTYHSTETTSPKPNQYLRSTALTSDRRGRRRRTFSRFVGPNTGECKAQPHEGSGKDRFDHGDWIRKDGKSNHRDEQSHNKVEIEAEQQGQPNTVLYRGTNCYKMGAATHIHSY